MRDARARLFALLEAEVAGRYDLTHYTADDLYWEVVNPVAEENFGGLRQRDVITWTQEWMDQLGAATIPKSRTDGDCFLVAAHLGVGFEPLGLEVNDDDDVRVVHGLPVGRGDLNGGRRFWHGWVEVTLRTPLTEDMKAMGFGQHFPGNELVTELVIDRSQGQNHVLPRAMYYNMGQLDEDHVWRFTVEEAREQMIQREHYGPWVEGWEELEEV